MDAYLYVFCSSATRIVCLLFFISGSDNSINEELLEHYSDECIEYEVIGGKPIMWIFVDLQVIYRARLYEGCGITLSTG